MMPIPLPHKNAILALIIASVVLSVGSVILFILEFTMQSIYLGVFQSIAFFLALILLFLGMHDKKEIAKLVNGENLLAHWFFDSASWKSFIESEYQRQKENAITTAIAFFIVGPIAGLIKDPENWYISGPIMGATLGGLGYFIGIISAKSFATTAQSSPPEIFIGNSGIYVHGLFISFNGVGRRLMNIEILPDPHSQQQSLKIVYSVRGKYGMQEREFFVPIPAGKGTEAKNILSQLQFR